jgi:hypothetical protein
VSSWEERDGIRRILALFKGRFSLREILWSVAVGVMAVFVPAFLYPKIISVYGLLKRFKIVTF